MIEAFEFHLERSRIEDDLEVFKEACHAEQSRNAQTVRKPSNSLNGASGNVQGDPVKKKILRPSDTQSLIPCPFFNIQSNSATY